jgi:hypothetical protein
MWFRGQTTRRPVWRPIYTTCSRRLAGAARLWLLPIVTWLDGFGSTGSESVAARPASTSRYARMMSSAHFAATPRIYQLHPRKLDEAARGIGVVGPSARFRDIAEKFLASAGSGTVRTRSGTRFRPNVVREYERSLRLHVVPNLGGMAIGTA